jgi:hypothetical protein
MLAGSFRRSSWKGRPWCSRMVPGRDAAGGVWARGNEPARTNATKTKAKCRAAERRRTFVDVLGCIVVSPTVIGSLRALYEGRVAGHSLKAAQGENWLQLDGHSACGR